METPPPNGSADAAAGDPVDVELRFATLRGITDELQRRFTRTVLVVMGDTKNPDLDMMLVEFKGPVTDAYGLLMAGKDRLKMHLATPALLMMHRRPPGDGNNADDGTEDTG